MSKLSHSNPNLDDVLHAVNAHKALGKKYPDGCCPRCGVNDCSPNVGAFEISGEAMCDECAEEVFEESSQFGVGS